MGFKTQGGRSLSKTMANLYGEYKKMTTGKNAGARQQKQKGKR